MKLRVIVSFLSFLSIILIELAFTTPQLNKISVDGKAEYDTKTYGNQKVKVYITEDGKSYKTIYADQKGNFRVNVDFNHTYVVHMSMDYHGTSKVLLDTKVPSGTDTETSGGLIQFKCQLFELYEGLNTAILNKPIMKMRYFEDKKDFDFDRKYTEDLAFDLEGFLNRIEELKKRRKDVVINETQAQEVLAKEDKIKKERKIIEFEKENEKPKAVNAKGSRSIMDLMNDEEEDEEEELVVAEEEMEVEPENEQSEEVESTIAATEEEEEENLFLEEELDESEYTALNVVPKRIKIDGDEIVSGPVAPRVNEEFEIRKMKIREVQEIKRIEEESKIRDVVNSYNQSQLVQRIERMGNKKVQTDRLRNLIKTISLAEIYYKKAYYKKYPINHNEVIPSVVVHKNESMWKDEEKVMLRYPSHSITFRKETYLFGITYYYKGDEKIDEDTYCSGVTALSKNNFECVI